MSVVFVGHTAREGTPALLGLPPLQRPTARAPCTLQSAERDAVPPQGGPPVGPTPQSRSPRGRPVRLQEQKEHLATHGPGGNRVRETLCWVGAGASGLETCSTEKTPGREARGRRGGREGALLPLPLLAGDEGVWEEWAAAPGGSTARPGLQRQPCASRPSLSGSSVATSGRDAGP